MKFCTPLVVATVILGAGANAQEENPCIICPDGASAGDDYAPFDGDSITCKDIIEGATVYEAGSKICDSYQGSYSYEYICCPGAGANAQVENPCIICPDGASAGDDYAPFADHDGYSPQGMCPDWTCKDIIEKANLFDTDSDVCKSFMPVGEFYCCPTLAENPCICPDGLTVDGDVIIPDSNGTTCEEGLAFLKFIDAESDVCDESRKEGGMVCCPATTTEELSSTVAATVASLEESSSNVVATTAAPERGSETPFALALDDVTELDSGASMFGSGFSGFAFMPVASALYAVAFM